MPTAAALRLRRGDKDRLVALVRSPSVRTEVARLAGILILASEGVATVEIARRLGVSRPTVLAWRNRYRTAGIAALTGPEVPFPVSVDTEVEVITTTLRPPPGVPGSPLWTAARLADHLGIAFPEAVTEVWLKWDLQPARVDAFRLPSVPKLRADVQAVVALSLNPAGRALVVCVDDRPVRPASDARPNAASSTVSAPGRSKDRVPESSHDVHRAAAALAAALDSVPAQPVHRRGHASPLAHLLPFLQQVTAAHPGVRLQVIVDTAAAHPQPALKDWLVRRPLVTVHTTRTARWWTDIAAICATVADHPRDHTASPAQAAALAEAITGYSDDPRRAGQVFTWVTTADLPRWHPGTDHRAGDPAALQERVRVTLASA